MSGPTTEPEVATVSDASGEAAPPQGLAAAPRRGIVREVLASTEGRIAVALLLLLTVICIAGPWLAPYGPAEINVGRPLQGPSASHLLGTDDFGRDVLSRVLSGGREVLIVPFASIALAFLLGGLAGIAAAYRGGTADLVFSRTSDVGLALPPLLLVLVVVATEPGSNAILIAAVALVFAPRIGRVVRGAAQSVVTNEYVELARARGEGALSVAVREIMPNISATVAVELALRLNYAIIFVATLSFLGVGAQPPSSNWGLMIAQGRDLMGTIPLVVVAPALCLALLAISLNVLADTGSRAFARDVTSDSGVF